MEESIDNLEGEEELVKYVSLTIRTIISDVDDIEATGLPRDAAILRRKECLINLSQRLNSLYFKFLADSLDPFDEYDSNYGPPTEVEFLIIDNLAFMELLVEDFMYSTQKEIQIAALKILSY
eukprot:Sdes_comp21920_c0_seq1m20465